MQQPCEPALIELWVQREKELPVATPRLVDVEYREPALSVHAGRYNPFVVGRHDNVHVIPTHHGVAALAFVDQGRLRHQRLQH